MSIETYTTTIICFYIGLILLFILIGTVDIWNRIEKKTIKYWWGIIPCFILYLISVTFSIYIGLIFLFILIGAVNIWNRIEKKTIKYWWGIIPCSILYLISATFSTLVASMAYDDPTDPNYATYGNWELRNFILHDIKTFVIWLLIGVLLYLIFGRKSTKKSIKIGCVILLVFLMIILAVIMALSTIQLL